MSDGTVSRGQSGGLSMPQAKAMASRADLLEAEARVVRLTRSTWSGRLAQLGQDYGHSGGSAADRRLIVEGMAALEAMAS